MAEPQKVRSILDGSRRKSGGAKPPGQADLPEDATHAEIAEHWQKSQPSPGPVFNEGALYVYREGIWVPDPPERCHVDIGRRYARLKNCRRRSDIKGILDHVGDLSFDPEFFSSAPVGVHTPGGFYRVDGKRITCEPCAHELRQRFRIGVEPDDAAPDLFDEFLDATFRHDDAEIWRAQQQLLQEIIGAALVGILWRHQKAVLFYGVSGAGKSVVLHILDALFPPEYVSSVSPFDWWREYSRAVLAGKRLNLCGELPNDRDIPAREFKQIIGGDRIDARNPYGRPFSFIAHCAHFFSSNHLPPTRDTHTAFWRRWIAVGFFNSVAERDRDPDLPQRIVDEELPRVVGWALEGARRLLEQGGFTDSQASREIIDRWRLSADAVAEFLADAAIVRHGDAARVLRTDLYDAFRGWCKDSERKPVGRGKFYERVEGLGYLQAKGDGGSRFFLGFEVLK